MFAALGNHDEALHRCRIGGLDLRELAIGHWRISNTDDIQRLFGG
jgi:16S rRNA pseudouridine516 synthase